MQAGKEAEVDGKLLPEIVSRIDGWRMVKRGKYGAFLTLSFPFSPYPALSFVIEKPNEEKHPRQIHSTGGTILKVREIIKIIEGDGWYLVATKGSHRQFKHPEKTGRITIAGHLTDDLAHGTLNSIFKQAQLKE